MARRNFILTLLFIVILNPPVFAQKYPDFAQQYLGEDKFENFNRKMFLFNGALNKFAIRPVTVVWSLVVPKYGMERLKCAYSNILYPRRLVSSLVQKDFKAAGRATARFLTNSTLGLGGMFDPAKKIFKMEPVSEDMEQAFAKLKVKSGPYLVVPVLSSSTPRGLLGRAFDSALDPTSYVGSPIIGAVKAGFTINNATYAQPLIKTFENSYIDPYDVAKKAYGISVAIMNANLDRKEELQEKTNKSTYLDNNIALYEISDNDLSELVENIEYQTFDKKILNVSETETAPSIKGHASTDEIIYENDLVPDIILKDFNPMHPVIDSMRTALFDLEGVDESFWGEMSPWNRCFKNRIKTGYVQLAEDKEKYRYKYIMQKDKNAPIAIIYPSVGEGVDSHHSVIFAKLFYDEGYSVVIQGSAFHHSFIKSLREDYKPGIPVNDVKYLREATDKIVKNLESKYGTQFKNKVVFGTSFGAMSALFLADLEAKDNKLNITKFISVNPPIELLYAMDVIDENSEEWNKNPDSIKEDALVAAAKVLKSAQMKEDGEFDLNAFPFSVQEAKLITGFVLHQKLSDVLFAIENIPVNKKTDFYQKVNDMNYKDYALKYLTDKNHPTLADFSNNASLHAIKDYLKSNQNYRIYHSLDDYLVNISQLKQLKSYAKEKLTLIDKGSHLGFLYRNEFIEDLRKEISLKEKPKL